MHIADGILPASACVAAHAAALGGVWLAGRKIEPEEVVRMGLLSSAIFVVSMVHFPLGGTSIHLGLFGLAGILLGWRSFPVVYVSLLFQALLFQHGGLLALGVNTLNMAAGTLTAFAIWRMKLGSESNRAFLAGFVGALAPALLMTLEFFLAGYGKGFAIIATLYSVVALIEGALTVFIVTFLRRVKPAVFCAAPAFSESGVPAGE